MTKRALVIGIDKYDRLPLLKGCVGDANEVSKRLTQPVYGFDVQMLTDSEVTRKALRSAIQLVLSNAEFSLIYFAGHGLQASVNTYLATADSEWDDEGVDVGFIVNAINRLAKPTQTVVVILDCCHAGDTPFPSEIVKPIEQSGVPALTGSARLVMAACLGDQKAKESAISDGEFHGRFSKYLLEALDGMAADRDSNITVSAAYEYIATKLEAAGTQRPMLRGDQSGRIILASGVKATSNSPVAQGVYVQNEIVREAEEHAAQYFDSIQQIGLKDYESRGHLEACQRLAPIIEWFERQISANGDLLRDNAFKKSWTNIHQQYQQLSNITSGIVLEKSREVGDLIGGGTFGTVWKIIDRQQSSPICFKSYHATELRDSNKVGRFMRGYRAMTQLDHPNIVKVYESTVVPLGFYMQYIEGANLRQYNPASVCEVDQILDILLEVGETLSHTHGRNVLHRDVKPENILLKVSDDGELSPFLTDYDLSWFSTATKLTRLAGDGFGSHFYAAPEQMNSPASPAAHRSTVDAYSFGQVMFFAFCGHDPAILNGSDNIKVFETHLGRLAITDGVASELISLYRDCTQHAADKRLGDFREICDRLSKALSLHRTTDAVITSHQFLQELRFLISGVISKAGEPELRGHVSIKTPSGRSEISVILKHEDSQKVAIEATFISGQSPVVMGASSAADARKLVNERIDGVLNKFHLLNNARRSAPKGGAYQSIVTFNNIEKNAEGLSRCRELLMGVVDSMERS